MATGRDSTPKTCAQLTGSIPVGYLLSNSRIVFDHLRSEVDCRFEHLSIAAHSQT